MTPVDVYKRQVSPFINIGLGAAEYIAGIMPHRQKLRIIRQEGTAVIRRIDQDGIFKKSQFLQFPVDPSRHIITVQDKIPIFIRTGFSPELLCRKDGGMGSRHGKIKKERFLPVFLYFFQDLILSLIHI